MVDMTRYRDTETGEVVTARILHQRFAVGLWSVSWDGTGPLRDEEPEVWVIEDEGGQERTLRRIEDDGGDAGNGGGPG